ncbi:MAG: hypothetical protein WCV55_00215 [Candidatus Paceibacterota bacterium]
MAEEFTEGDAYSWQNEGQTPEEKTAFVLKELEEFNSVSEPHKEDLDRAYDKANFWALHISDYAKADGDKKLIQEALIKTKAKIAKHYLTDFKYMENLEVSDFERIYNLIKFLNLKNNMDFLLKSSDPESQKKQKEALLGKIDEILGAIAANYPEILES